MRILYKGSRASCTCVHSDSKGIADLFKEYVLSGQQWGAVTDLWPYTNGAEPFHPRENAKMQASFVAHLDVHEAGYILLFLVSVYKVPF